MLLKKLLYLFIIIFTLAIFQECCGPEPRYFRRKNMQVKHTSTNGSWHQFSSSPFTLETSWNYLLMVDFDIDYIASSGPKFPNFFINQCYATPGCEEVAGSEGALEKITEINITSEADFDNTLIAGQSLNKLFRLLNTTSNISTSLDSVKLPSDIVDKNKSFRFILTSKPSADSIHFFKVDLTLSSGQIISAKGPGITFSK